MSDLHKKLMLNSPLLRNLPPRIPTSPSPSEHPGSAPGSAAGGRRTALKNKKDYSILPWSNYFDRIQCVETTKENKFRVYIKGDSGPVVFFLHGGGFSGLSWSLLSSILVKKIKCQCYSLDIRGHGDSYTTNDEDLSIDTLTNDIKSIVELLWEDESPPILLVGHSMGGALAVHTANRNYIKNLIGLVVIDVVEGSAMEALSSMQSFLQGRPKTFDSIEKAIEYSVRSGQIRNPESARVSMLGQLRKEIVNPNKPVYQSLGSQSHVVMQTELVEEDEEDEDESKAVSSSSTSKSEPKRQESASAAATSESTFKEPENINERYVWRIDLTKTEKFWASWFKGLSSMLLAVSAPKLLLLAGVDRLDRELMVGQMQGKFQMQVLPQCGHAIHEDSPESVADAISNFMLRNKFTEAIDHINPPDLCC